MPNMFDTLYVCLLLCAILFMCHSCPMGAMPRLRVPRPVCAIRSSCEVFLLGLEAVTIEKCMLFSRLIPRLHDPVVVYPTYLCNVRYVHLRACRIPLR